MARASGSKKPDALGVLRRLSSHYKSNGTVTALGELSPLQDPFRVLIATVLSQRTKDEVTASVESSLFRNYPGPSDIAGARLHNIEKAISRVGFYKTKAKALKEISRQLIERFDGRVPEDMEMLLSLPMVGRKTANCVLVYGFGKSAIPVDTHVHRVSNRLGWVKTAEPEETEEHLEELIPRKYWIIVNETLVNHGKNICRPIRPRCLECPVSNKCSYALSSRSAWNKS